MKPLTTILAAGIAPFLVCNSLFADTTDDFGDDANPDTFSTFDVIGLGTGPEVIDTGTEKFLRIIHEENSQNNLVTYDQSDAGTFSTITANFDLRGSKDTSAADGVSFSLIPTATYGISGSGHVFGNPAAEEPNVAGIFGVGFDLYNNINEISGHWDGRLQVQTNPNPADTVNLNSGLWHGAEITLQQVGNGSNATVIVTPDSQGVPGTPFTYWSNVMPNLLPFDNRVEFAGRTGGANMNFDLDNLNVTYSNPFDINTLPVVTPDGLFQDFDSVGTTNYYGSHHVASINGTNRPGALLTPGDAGSTGVFLRLINDATNSNKNSIAFDRAVDGGVSNEPQTLSFDFRMSSAGTPADGLGVYVLPTYDYGITGGGNGAPAFEQQGLAGSLHVGFDVYPGGTAGATDNDIVLTVDAIEVARINVDPGAVDFDAGVFHKAELTLTPVETGMEVSLTITPDINGTPGTPVDVIPSTLLPGLIAIDYRVQFGGRTGGLFVTADLDNIQTTSGLAPLTDYTKQIFELSEVGTGYKCFYYGAGRAPELVTEGDVQPNTFLRLIHDGNNSQNNHVAFEQSTDGGLGGDQLVIADFDFRVTSAAFQQGADGFSLRFLPVGDFGTSGEGPMGGAEEPNIANVFAIGFDIHPADSVNDVSVHWNNAELQNLFVDPGVLDLDDGEWHHVRVIWQPSGGGSAVSVILDETETIVDGFVISDLPLYAYRLQFAARSGGRNMSVDLDNIFAAASDVVNADTDGDGLLNVWEEENDLDPLSGAGDDGADGDPDMDGSNNLEEQARMTDPQDEDSDDDNLEDGQERGENGYVSDQETGTDPLDPDSDGDGIMDGVENPLVAYDPNDPFNTPGTDPNLEDTDGDLFTDLAELKAGTDPTDLEDKPELAGTIVLKEDFDIFHLNSTYALTNSSGAAPAVVDSQTTDFYDVIRLANNTGSINNSIAWDYVEYAAPEIRLSYIYHMSADGGSQSADGLGVGLFGTGTYGATGAANPGTAVVWENPAAGAGHLDALVIGFDIYDGGDGLGNEIRIAGLGGSADLIYNQTAPYTLNNGLFNEVTLHLISDGNGGSTLNVTIIEDVNGTPITHNIATGLPVAGLDPLTFQGRVIAGSRTGGAFVTADLECVQIESIPAATDDFRITSIDYDETLQEVNLTWEPLPGITSYSIWTSTNLIDWDEEVSGINGTSGTVEGISPSFIPDWFFQVRPTQILVP